MALAERSDKDLKRFIANTATFSKIVEARNAAPLLQGEELKAMIDAAAQIDLSKLGSSKSKT